MSPRFLLFILIPLTMTGWASSLSSDVVESPEAPPPIAPEILLIEKMGASSAKERDDATMEIWKKGKSMLPFLEKARLSDDPEIVERAKLLIPKLKYNVPHDKKSPIGTFIDNYSSSNNMERGEIFSTFMLRPDLSPQEASAAMEMLIELPPYEMEALPPQWALDIYLSLLDRSTFSLLDEGKVEEAVDLWSRVNISPIIRRRYAAMLYNSGIPLAKERFPENIAKLIEADIALLNNDPERAKEINPEEDEYISQRIATAQFDLKQRWNHLLNPLSTVDNCIPWELPIRWIFADIDKNEEIKNQVVRRLITIAATGVTPSENPEISEGPQAPPDESFLSPLDASRMLLALGKEKQAYFLATKYIWQNPTELSLFISIISSPHSLALDIKDTGAKEDSLPAILDLAKKISFSSSTAKNPLSPVPDEDEMSNSGISDENILKIQKIVFLTAYLSARGEGYRMKPFIIHHIRTSRGMERDILAFSYLDILSSLRCLELSFSIYETLLTEKLLPSESFGELENLITRSYMIDFAKQDQWYSLSEFIQTLSEEPLTTQEKLRRSLILIGSLKSSPEEKEKLFEQAITALKKLKQQEPDHAEYLAKALVEKIYFSGESCNNDIYRLINELDMLILPPDAPMLTREPEAISTAILYGPDSIKAKHKKYFYSQLQSSKLFSPSAKPAKRKHLETENIQDGMPHYSPQVTPEARSGEYLAALLHLEGKKDEAQALRKKSRLYAHSDNLMRRTNMFLLPKNAQGINDMFSIVSPAFLTNNEEDTDLSYPQEISAQTAQVITPYVVLARKTKEAQFLAHSSTITALSPQNINTASPLSLLSPRLCNLLAEAYQEKEKGATDNCLKRLKEAHNLASSISLGEFYYALNECFPEEKNVWELWYEEDRRLLLSLLEKWPSFFYASANLIESSLVLGKYPEETNKMISSISQESSKGFMICFAQGIKEMNAGNKESARRLFIKAINEYQGHTSFLLKSYLAKLSTPSRPTES